MKGTLLSDAAACYDEYITAEAADRVKPSLRCQRLFDHFLKIHRSIGISNQFNALSNSKFTTNDKETVLSCRYVIKSRKELLGRFTALYCLSKTVIGVDEWSV